MDKKTKWRTKFEEENASFSCEVQSLSTEEKKQRIVSLTMHLKEVEEALEQDENVEKTRALLNELLSPYKETKKVIKNKIKYLLEILNEQDNLNTLKDLSLKTDTESLRTKV